MEAEKIVNQFFSSISGEILEKASKIKLLITDIDGVLTDGGIIYDNDGQELKKFNVKDGLIVQHLRKNKILVGAITGRASKVVENRCEELKFDFHYHGVKDKGKRLKEIMDTLEISAEEVAYIGDDLIDLPILSQVGLAVVPSDAVEYIKPFAHHVSSIAGGRGVFRETGEILLHSRGVLAEIIENLVKKGE